jgi:hypothetical protein
VKVAPSGSSVQFSSEFVPFSFPRGVCAVQVIDAGSNSKTLPPLRLASRSRPFGITVQDRVDLHRGPYRAHLCMLGDGCERNGWGDWRCSK